MTDLDSEINRLTDHIKHDLQTKDISALLSDIGKIKDFIVQIDKKIAEYEDKIRDLESQKEKISPLDIIVASETIGANIAYKLIKNALIDKKINGVKDDEGKVKGESNDLRGLLAQASEMFNEYTVDSQSPVPFINLMIKQLHLNMTENKGNSEQIAALRALMVQIVALVEVAIAQISKNKQTSESNMSDAAYLNAEETTNRVVSSQKTNAEMKARLEQQQKIMKVVQRVITVALIGLAIMTGQFELLAVLVVVTALSEAGVFDKFHDAVSNALQDAGMDKDTADALASVIVFVVVVVACMGVGAAAGGVEAACSSSAETAGGAAEGAAETAVEEAAESAAAEASESAAAESGSADSAISNSESSASRSATRAERIQGKLRNSAINGMKSGVPLGIMNSDVVVNTMMTIIAKSRHESVEQLEKEVSWLRGFLSAIQALITMAAGFGAAKSAGKLESSEGVVSKIKDFFSKNPKLESALNSLVTGSMATGFLVQGGSEVYQAVLNAELAKNTKELGEADSALVLLNQIMMKLAQMAKDEAKASGEQMSHGIQNLNASIEKMDSEGVELSNLLAETCV